MKRPQAGKLPAPFDAGSIYAIPVGGNKGSVKLQQEPGLTLRDVTADGSGRLQHKRRLC